MNKRRGVRALPMTVSVPIMDVEEKDFVVKELVKSSVELSSAATNAY